MQPEDFIGLVVLVGSVTLTIFGVIWLPILRRRELREIEEQQKKPIAVEIRGSMLLNPDNSERLAAIEELNLNTPVKLARTVNENQEASVSLVTGDGQVVGVLPAETGAELAVELEAGKRITAEIKSMTGGSRADPEYRLTVELNRTRN